jgi:DNA modification methylase
VKQEKSHNNELAKVSDINKSKAILKRINWDFHEKNILGTGQNNPIKCSSHFWGPATFVPEIPFTLIEVLSTPGAVVYDPFSGVGTTYFQSLILNRNPIATDICKVNTTFIESFLTLFDPNINLRNLLEATSLIINNYHPETEYSKEFFENILMSKLKPWYSEKTFNRLAFLFKIRSEAKDPVMRAALWISTSCILRTLSSQDRGWGCIADNVLPKPEQLKDKDVFGLFLGHFHRLIKDISAHIECAPEGFAQFYRNVAINPRIYHTDVRANLLIENKSVDLIVTSPPYPNMTDYANSRRLSYYHMGIEPSIDSKLEIGARIRRTAKGSVETYISSMESANSEIISKLKIGGLACYVMPVFEGDKQNNIVRQIAVEKVMKKLEDFSLVLEDNYERILPKLHRQHNLNWTKLLERERIYLFRKV